MKPPYLLIWFKDGEAHATGLTELPNAIAYEGRIFQSVGAYLGDADYLRDKQNRLVGFSYILGEPSEQEEVLYQSLLAQNKSVERDSGMLLIILKSDAFDIQCVQAVGSQLYLSSSNEFMFAVPNCGFGELAFKLTMSDTPMDAGVPA